MTQTCLREGCDNPVKVRKGVGGPPKKYCCVRCKNLYWDATRKALKEPVPPPPIGICAMPGCENETPIVKSDPSKRRSYCSDDCRVIFNRRYSQNAIAHGKGGGVPRGKYNTSFVPAIPDYRGQDIDPTVVMVCRSDIRSLT